MSLYRKYRPQTFADVIGQDHVKQTIQNQITRGEVSHAYLFMGPRGIGKTTIARLLAKAINCTKREGAEPCNTCSACIEITQGSALDVFEIDAASHTDVDHVREHIIKNIRFAPTTLARKVFIIDEVHMLSTSAFNALLKTLEEPPAHALFILATTEIHKIPETIISRCQRFDFSRMSRDVLSARLLHLSEEEGIEVSQDVVEAVIRQSDGCVRDAESLLGQVFALGEKKITMETAALILPQVTTGRAVELVEDLWQGKSKAVVDVLARAVFEGVNLDVLRDELVQVVRDLMMSRIAGADFEEYPADLTTRLTALSTEMRASKVDAVAWLRGLIDQLIEAKQRPRSEQIPQLLLELALLPSVVTKTSTSRQELVSETTLPPQTTAPVDFPPREVASVGPPVEYKKDISVIESVQVDHNEPIAVSENVVDGVPLLSLDEVQRKWPEVFAQIKKSHATLPFSLHSATVTALNGNEIEFACGFELHADTINKEKNRQVIEGVCEQVMGKKVKIRATYQHTEADDAVATLVAEFGGSVV